MQIADAHFEDGPYTGQVVNMRHGLSDRKTAATVSKSSATSLCDDADEQQAASTAAVAIESRGRRRRLTAKAATQRVQ